MPNARPDGLIYLVGPGGAGKTTVGLALARRLGIAFVDLDEHFTFRVGDISAFMAAHGYQVYAAQNIQICVETIGSLREEAVIVLSSGFITYPDDIHPAYRRMRHEVVDSPHAFVLLPSFDYETCVAETVRRQLKRPFSRSAEREEQVIRDRVHVYRDLPVRKFETMGPVDAVVENLVACLMRNSLAADDGRSDRVSQSSIGNQV